MIKTIFSLILLLSFASNAQEIECQYAPSEDFTGTCESFYTNGNIRSQTDFLNGLRHGKYREYYADGKIAAIATFHEDSYIGKIFRFSPDSTVVFAMELDSTESGEFVALSNDGSQLVAMGKFKNSYRDGLWNFYDQHEEWIKTVRYNSDSTRNEIYGDKDATDIYIPYVETVDNLFFDEYGLPIEVRPETIVDDPDEFAEFPNGTAAMKEFIRTNVTYPPSAIKNKQEGKVYVSFIVELDGSLTEVKLLRGVYEDLDTEAIRVVKSMPNWTPATYNNQTVRSKCYLPITFIL